MSKPGQPGTKVPLRLPPFHYPHQQVGNGNDSPAPTATIAQPLDQPGAFVAKPNTGAGKKVGDA
jgi:hypothetical protein